MRSLLSGVIVAAASVSQAQPLASGLDLDWRAPPGCPDEAAVRGRIEALLSEAQRHAALTGIRVIAQVTTKDAGFAADLEFHSPSGDTREHLVAPRCETLAGVVALKVSLAVDPALEPSSTPEAKRDTPTPSAVGAPASRAADRETGSVGLALRLAGDLSAGILPSPAFGLLAEAQLHVGRLEIAFGAEYGFAREVQAEGWDARADIAMLAATGRLCFLANSRPLELPLCGGVEVGQLRARGSGRDLGEARASTLGWSALEASAGLRWRFHPRMSARLDGAVVRSLQRPAFVVAELGPLHRPSVVAGRARLGLEVHFE